MGVVVLLNTLTQAEDYTEANMNMSHDMWLSMRNALRTENGCCK